MEKDAGIRLKELRVDGGASANNLLMQFQAGLLGVARGAPARCRNHRARRCLSRGTGRRFLEGPSRNRRPLGSRPTLHLLHETGRAKTTPGRLVAGIGAGEELEPSTIRHPSPGMNRADMLQRLRDEPGAWDVVVIGGGASGLFTAVDSASRGYRTALVEQADFAQATSSRSTKLIHGGIRYLQSGQLPLVRESLRERGHLLRNAPHLVHRLPFILPLYAWWERPFYGTGLKLYDRLAGNLAIGSSQHLSRTETLARMPALASNGLRGGILYEDGQFDDARLAVMLARTVADLGGVAVNYVKVVSLLKQNNRVCGVMVRDSESGNEFEVRARVVVNATGIFSDEVRRLDDRAAPELLTLSQGAHVVLDKSFLPGGCALIIPRTSDGRVFFALPWYDHVLLGTTDTMVSDAVRSRVRCGWKLNFSSPMPRVISPGHPPRRIF